MAELLKVPAVAGLSFDAPLPAELLAKLSLGSGETVVHDDAASATYALSGTLAGFDLLSLSVKLSPTKMTNCLLPMSA